LFIKPVTKEFRPMVQTIDCKKKKKRFGPILRTGSNESLKRFDIKEEFTFGNQKRAMCKDYKYHKRVV